MIRKINPLQTLDFSIRKIRSVAVRVKVLLLTQIDKPVAPQRIPLQLELSDIFVVKQKMYA